jgi:O-antigen/teichoic acid export membrane protein
MRARVRLLRGVSTRWLRMGTNILVGILLTPFVLHRLGDEGWGLYVLIFSLTGYFGLFDLGITASVQRYVAWFVARNEDENVNHYVNTAFFIYCLVGAAALVVSVIGTLYVDSIFRISPDFHRSAQFLFLIVGAGVAVGFPLGIFGGILEGLQRFPTVDLTGIVGTLVRAALVVAVLTHGLGLLAVALVTVGMRTLVPCIYVVLVFRALPLRIHWKHVDRKSFRLLVNYSLPVLVFSLGSQLFFASDEAITGMFISAASVAYFAVGARIVRYSTSFADAVGSLFGPLSSHYDATENLGGQRKILIDGSRACALTTFPLMVLFLILGKPIIQVWVGARYLSSYPILAVLIVATGLTRSEETLRYILQGMARHRPLAWLRIAEGSVNIVLSVLLLHWFGILGVALGTAIPMTLSALFYYPPHLCRILKTPLSTFVTRAFLPPLAFCVPLGAVLFALKDLFPKPSVATLAIQAGGGGLVYGALVLWFVFTRDPLGLKAKARLAEAIRGAFSR